MSIKRKFATVFASLALVLPVGIGAVNQQAHASYKGPNQFPTELRGTWYQTFKNVSNHVRTVKIKFTKHHLYMNKIKFLKTGYNSFDNRGDNLFVSVNRYAPKQTGFAGNVYTIVKDKTMKKSLSNGIVYVSKRKIGGHHVLITMDLDHIHSKKHYSADVGVWTRTKIHHNYSYSLKGGFKKVVKEIGK
ncbi:hypothetical protein WR164_01590 [Philodulcilactobacillus myokoensis]|uniref:DUF4767 domain-containing protein n=1 Tax=Philodulcilactobacillus myokoensis TaxID=2929573 RepID=A0A9W6AZ40_9LACO|nr:hypothetical protein [Philodulcilactobacillus myokoensis]GLB46180.1 hypothetical protein WR164_01590 [Philodulcilactobacillus myokoensis]